jgi:hypothetical protein
MKNIDINYVGKTPTTFTQTTTAHPIPEPKITNQEAPLEAVQHKKEEKGNTGKIFLIGLILAMAMYIVALSFRDVSIQEDFDAIDNNNSSNMKSCSSISSKENNTTERLERLNKKNIKLKDTMQFMCVSVPRSIS